MTRQFILDENTLILAQKQESDRGEYDLTCLHLLNQIIEICHPMVVDYALWGKYQSQLSGLTETSPGYPHVLSILQRALQIDRKIIFQPNAPAFPEEAHIAQGSQDDVEHVRLAVATGATLVTTDNPLITDLASSGIAESYQLQVVTPEDALTLL